LMFKTSICDVLVSLLNRISTCVFKKSNIYQYLSKISECVVPIFIIACVIYRARDVATRKKYVALVDSVKNNNGDVKVFSSLHVSGERKLEKD